METMFGMSLLKGLLIIWAVETSVVVLLLIYRSTLGAHEDDQLYLSRGEDMLQRQQQETISKERKLAPFLYVLGAASGLLLLSIAAVWIWQGLLMT
jgi:hypothetical protein